MAFPQTANDVRVELFYDSAWNNITIDAFDRDSPNSVTITRGRANEGGRCDPGRATFSLNNANGKYSPRNPNSTLYGKIGRNTQVRISVVYNSITYIRFVGEITAWPSRWDLSGKNVWVQVEAWGILRRLGQGSSPLKSALRRSLSGSSPLAYWPMEDVAGSRRFASDVSGVNPLRFAGSPTPTLATVTGLVGSQAFADFVGAGALSVPRVESVTVTGAAAGYLSISFVYRGIKVSGKSPGWTPMRIHLSGGSDAFIEVNASIQWNGSAFVNGSLDFGSPGNFIIASSIDPFDGLVHDAHLIARQNGGNVEYEMWLDGTLRGSHSFAGTLGAPRKIRGIEPFDIWAPNTDNTNSHFALGHVALHNSAGLMSAASLHSAAGGNAGEQAHVRVQRLCTEEGISIAVTGASSALMGPQRVATLLENLDDCANTDRGFLYEQRAVVGLAYRTNASRYGQ